VSAPSGVPRSFEYVALTGLLSREPFGDSRTLGGAGGFEASSQAPSLWRNYNNIALSRFIFPFPNTWVKVLLVVESRGIEPHPISENLVFKASRRTNPAALLSKLVQG